MLFISSTGKKQPLTINLNSMKIVVCGGKPGAREINTKKVNVNSNINCIKL